ncbi:helix-turn-helix domain-containing protein [Micromonospora coxensis]|uniref:DNA-binding transcriptional regulator, MerR family n=1 Tax=Micromonospora coxensis TaxID=356852 RepID=A0A1C5HT83_9ACTN|nr:MerR family transcriptional regulator [Micromonospora coxensis]SCG49219.1 DNA-binding transcriptional regulator, MerR family [Micromonospora coxensis]
MDDRDALFTIGQLARRTGLTVRTVRFWSDEGLLPPTGRSSGGHRLYDAAAVARLELVRTLRELGIGLEQARAVLDRQRSVAEVAAAHVRALDAEIRTLRLHRAVLRSITRRGGTTEELRLVTDLARLTARERQQIIDDFVTEVFAGLPTDAPGAGLAAAMRALPAELPDEPTDAEVDAWLELAGLVRDPGFRRRVREMAVAGAADDAPAPAPLPDVEPAREAVAAGVAPDSPAAREIVERIVGPSLSEVDRVALADRLATFTDRRVERYWQLVGVLRRQPPFPPTVPAVEWLIDALRGQHGTPRIG